MLKKCCFILTVIFVLFAGCTNDNDSGKKPVTFSISIDRERFGSGTIRVKDNLKEAAKGKKITLIATPDNYYRLASVTVKGEESDDTIPVSGDGNERTFTMPGEPVKVTAASWAFESGVYGITIMGQYYNGWVTSLDGDRYNAGVARAGDTVTLIIVPEDGYYLSQIFIKGKTTGNNVPDADITIDNVNKKVTFKMPDEEVGIPDFNNGLIFLPVE